MGDDPIPENVRRLVERHFTSVSELEALLALVRDRRSWTPRDLARALVINDEHAAALLATLVGTRLLGVEDGAYTFDPAKARDRAAVEALSELYDTYRLRIMNIVFSKPSDPLHDFADAFRLRPRGETEEGGV